MVAVGQHFCVVIREAANPHALLVLVAAHQHVLLVLVAAQKQALPLPSVLPRPPAPAPLSNTSHCASLSPPGGPGDAAYSSGGPLYCPSGDACRSNTLPRAAAPPPRLPPGLSGGGYRHTTLRADGSRGRRGMSPSSAIAATRAESDGAGAARCRLAPLLARAAPPRVGARVCATGACGSNANCGGVRCRRVRLRRVAEMRAVEACGGDASC
eukprot:363870-Chlamydomonas_euryale.AAC.4